MTRRDGTAGAVAHTAASAGGGVVEEAAAALCAPAVPHGTVVAMTAATTSEGEVQGAARSLDDAWIDLERPGYFGARRDARHRELDERHGPANWRLSWRFGARQLTFEEVCLVYEDAYYAFLRTHSEVLDQLCRDARDVYDDACSNVSSGLDYLAQETGRTHVQDIAIRRCLRRLGRRFTGGNLVQIRSTLGTHPLSVTLSPGHVPFHRPELIGAPQLEGWWEPNSVEAFYQSNKWIQVRPEDRRH